MFHFRFRPIADISDQASGWSKLSSEMGHERRQPFGNDEPADGLDCLGICAVQFYLTVISVAVSYQHQLAKKLAPNNLPAVREASCDRQELPEGRSNVTVNLVSQLVPVSVRQELQMRNPLQHKT